MFMVLGGYAAGGADGHVHGGKIGGRVLADDGGVLIAVEPGVADVGQGDRTGIGERDVDVLTGANDQAGQDHAGIDDGANPGGTGDAGDGAIGGGIRIVNIHDAVLHAVNEIR